MKCNRYLNYWQNAFRVRPKNHRTCFCYIPTGRSTFGPVWLSLGEAQVYCVHKVSPLRASVDSRSPMSALRFWDFIVTIQFCTNFNKKLTVTLTGRFSQPTGNLLSSICMLCVGVGRGPGKDGRWLPLALNG